MQEWWQHLPETFDPIAFTIGFFAVYWYALFFLGGFLVVFLLALRFARRGEAPCSAGCIFDLFPYVLLGALVGGRIGYVLVYNAEAFFAAPLPIIIPYDFERGSWVGISGMSYHGGLIGVIAVIYWFARQQRFSFWKMADFLAFLAPLAIVFGRLGNFVNGELHGRITQRPWGMLFPEAVPVVGVLRHPSTLYEVFSEGMLLFIILLFFRKKMPFSGALACVFVLSYAALRFLVEFFRSPDPQLGFFFGVFTMGQLLSFVMFLAAGAVLVWLKHRNRANMRESIV